MNNDDDEIDVLTFFMVEKMLEVLIHKRADKLIAQTNRAVFTLKV